MSDVQQCPVHDYEMDEDCDGCKAEVAARTAALDALHTDVRNRAKGLRQTGFSPKDLGEIADSLKVTILWEMIFQGRAAFQAEEELGKRLQQTLKSIQETNRQNGLVTPTQGLHVVRDRKKG